MEEARGVSGQEGQGAASSGLLDGQPGVQLEMARMEQPHIAGFLN